MASFWYILVFYVCSSVSIVNFEQVNADWDKAISHPLLVRLWT